MVFKVRVYLGKHINIVAFSTHSNTARMPSSSAGARYVWYAPYLGCLLTGWSDMTRWTPINMAFKWLRLYLRGPS